MKRSLDSIIRRLLQIYHDRSQCYYQDGDSFIGAIWEGKRDGMAILYERIDLTGKVLS